MFILQDFECTGKRPRKKARRFRGQQAPLVLVFSGTHLLVCMYIRRYDNIDVIVHVFTMRHDTSISQEFQRQEH